jgi:transcriptional regulator with XRE-family HTH domain
MEAFKMAYKNKKFGELLGTLIKEGGWTKKKVAMSVGVAESTIGKYIREGRVPEEKILGKIAKLFKMTPKELLFGKNPLKDNSSIHEHPYLDKYREMVMKLVEILEGVNKVNAEAIAHKLHVFHKTKDIASPKQISMSSELLRTLNYKQWLLAGKPERRKVNHLRSGKKERRKLQVENRIYSFL